MNRPGSFSQVFGYTMAGILSIAGVLMVVGLLGPDFVGGTRLRSLFGVVLILYGVFRFVSVRFAARRAEDDA
ncbi:MAG: hypothetical protein HY710_03240 [Candidatus Latescibacteria bacterium]|nr:hypothetical protein [Candidatus Latescibacterota bacterium]